MAEPVTGRDTDVSLLRILDGVVGELVLVAVSPPASVNHNQPRPDFRVAGVVNKIQAPGSFERAFAV